MKRVIFAFTLLCLSVNSYLAQTNQIDPFEGARISARLKPLLAERVEQFIEVQQQGKWNQIFDFLARNQKNSLSKTFTDEQKLCVIELIKTNQMVNFTNLKTSFTTANFSRPLNKKVWFIRGEAEIKTSSGILKHSTSISARYFNKNWFFSLPEYYYDEWKRKKLAQADLSREMNELLKVIEQPDSPVEIFDIKVKINPEYYSLRNYSFKVRNKTKKTISSYGYRIIEAGMTVGSPNDIESSEFALNSGSYGANQSFCDDQELSVRLLITDIKFNDGTRWKSKLNKLSRF